MTHYLDIVLRPDPEFGPNVLLAALFAKLHRALVASPAQGEIAVSFPQYTEGRAPLGCALRLLGPQVALSQLMALNWISGMRDHTRLTPVLPVPATAQHRSIRRVQVQSSAERMRRRRMRRHNESAEDALLKIPDSAGANCTDLPWLDVHSTSSGGHRFKLFLRHGDVSSNPVSGEFNAYGLSNTATVAWF